MKNLQLNSKGPDVLFMQKLIGHPVLDACFGPKTEQDLKKWQSANGLKADGQCGPNTWKKLFELNPRTPASKEDLQKLAADLGCEYASLMAIKEVESGGKTSFTKEGRPIALHEGHIFWKYIKLYGGTPDNKNNEDILYPNWTKEFYKTGDAEYELIDRAFNLNTKAALESSSLGMFQIMGFNYKICGCKSPEEFWGRCMLSELEQIEMFAKFIKNNPKMHKALKDKDWSTFAKLYNGPEYAKNKYDSKLSSAYLKYIL